MPNTIEKNAVKIDAFEYLLYRLIEWQRQGGIIDNDISILKALKLTFFVSAVGTTRNSQNTLLDDVFDNFVAMPYGHVESDVYNNIKWRLHENIIIDNHKTVIKDCFNSELYDSTLRNRIDSSIAKLKDNNTNIVYLSSFDLVDLSHAWYSWQKNFRLAKRLNSHSHPIEKDEIKAEDKIYLI